MHRPLLSAAAALIALLPGGAPAQGLNDAVAGYRALFGAWASPGADCDTPAGLWRFDETRVTTGTGSFAIRGIGGTEGRIQLDLSGASPIALQPFRGDVYVSGAGLSTQLRRCPDGSATRDFDAEARRIEEELRRPAPGAPRDSIDDAFDRAQEGPATPPQVRVTPLDRPDVPDPDADPDDVALAAYRSRVAGAWRSADSPGCGWRFSEATVSTPEGTYDVVRFAGDDTRIGVNALDPEGTPVTVTVTPEGAGLTARVTGRGATALAPC